MNRCETCKHWKPMGIELGLCAAADGLMGYDPASKPLAWAESTDRDPGVLITRQQFGCVQWAASEPKDDVA